jgi:hypothetical protein
VVATAWTIGASHSVRAVEFVNSSPVMVRAFIGPSANFHQRRPFVPFVIVATRAVLAHKLFVLALFFHQRHVLFIYVA